MRRIIDYAQNRGIGELEGEVLADNQSMLKPEFDSRAYI